MSRRRRILFVAGLVAGLAAPALVATADPGDTERAGRQRAASERPRSRWGVPARKSGRQTRVVERRTARYLAKARELLLAQKYDEAQKLLGRLYLRHLHAYARALVFRVQAYAAYGKGQYDAAVASLRKALAERSLPPSDSADVLFQIAQIQGLQQKWSDAVETLKAWFEISPTPGSEAYFHLALAYFELKDLEDALGPAQKAVQLADVPEARWLQLLLSIQLTRQDYAAATPVLLDLLSRYPDVGGSYWIQLSALYGIQGDTARALAVLELTRRRGLLTRDRDLRRLAQLSQARDVPLRAARILEDGLDQQRIQPDMAAYELLANSWILARESRKGEEALSRAADLSPTGDLHLRLGQVMLQNQQWEQAARALHSAVTKGGLRDPAAAELLLGVAEFNAGHLGEARIWFAHARGTPKMRASADAWIEHVDHELQSQRAPTTTLSVEGPIEATKRRAQT